MTVTQLHTAFKIGVDKIDSLNYPDFTATEVDFLLNQGQERLVKQRYGLNNVYKRSFEEIQKRTEDLKELVKNYLGSPLPFSNDNIDINARFYTLPADHWFIVQERLLISYLDCDGKNVNTTVEVVPITHNEFGKAIKNPFKRPDITKVMRLMAQGQVEIIFNPTVNPGTYHLRYLKQPQTIDITTNTTSELSDYLHQEIVDEAIKIALEDIEARRLQTFENINQTKE